MACLGLILLSPILAVVSLIILIFMGRPILFLQIRPGLHGQPFTLVKFRTMRSEVGDGLPKCESERITRLGRVLRSTSLDELPELWNVLRGDMSLVGPRPLLMEYLPLYSDGQGRRHEVKPGITGWAQINGRNEISWQEKFKLDVWYVENRSIYLDLKILLITCYKAFAGGSDFYSKAINPEKFAGNDSESANVGDRESKSC